jgi:outer membrane PBP1 activator LpoA protein
MRRSRPWDGLLQASLVVFLLTACAEAPEREEAAGTLRTAQRLEQMGDYSAAAQIYAALAAGAETPQRETYQLRSADALLRGGDTAGAERVLRSVVTPAEPPRLRAERDILMGRLALAENHPAEALAIANGLQTEVLPPNLRTATEDLRAQAYAQQGKLIESIDSRIALQSHLIDPQAQWENEKTLWQDLMSLPPEELDRWQRHESRPEVSGWLELAALARQGAFEGPQGGQALAAWRARYPTHPAAVHALLALPAAAAAAAGGATQVALLLPLAGPLAPPAAAVRDGLLAAYYSRQEGGKPNLRIYDTAGTGAHVQDIYRRAVQDGARYVVGPLTKESVQVLAAAQTLPVPTLALNFVDALSPPPNLYQFGLAPEDEARQVAERAWADGHRSALALVPENAWGKRVLQAFRDRWEQLGGTLVATESFGDGQESLQGAVQRLIEPNAAATSSSSSAPPDQAVSQPQPRQDGDFLFMAAFPRQAVAVPPLLKFYLAGSLPIYATSHSFSGTVDAASRGDMEDIILCDMPWMSPSANPAPALANTLATVWPESRGSLARLYALGIDAYLIIPEIERLRASPSASFQGVTGTLSLDQSRHVRRELLCARFGDWGHLSDGT